MIIDGGEEGGGGSQHPEVIHPQARRIDFIMLDERDIVRHRLVNKIVSAYEKDSEIKG